MEVRSYLLFLFLLSFWQSFAKITIPLQSHLVTTNIQENITGRLGAEQTQPLDVPYQTAAFSMQLAFGSHQQVMSLLFDTGSSWTWVQLSNCLESDPNCDEFGYRYRSSSSFQATGDSTSIRYGSGGVSGEICTDSIYMRDSPTLGATDVLFLGPNPYSSLLSQRLPDLQDDEIFIEGILGMSCEDESSGPLWMDFMNEQSKLDEFRFGVLTREVMEEGSEVTIGGYNLEAISGDIHSHRVSGSFHWALNFALYAYDDEWVFPSVGKALIDTGTTNLILPLDDYTKLVDMMSANLPQEMKARSSSGRAVFLNCDSTSYFRPLSFQLDSVVYTIPPEFYIYSSNNVCQMKIGIASNDFWVFGITFLQLYYQVYDMDRYQVAFAVNKYAEGAGTIEELGSFRKGIVVIVLFALVIFFLLTALSYHKIIKRKYEDLFSLGDPGEETRKMYQTAVDDDTTF